MPLSPAVGTVSYNGFQFPPAMTTSVQGKPIPDSANRTIKYIEYTITVDCIITGDMAPVSSPGAANDNNIENIRTRLTRPRKQLIFIDQGFGDEFKINMADGSSSLVDVDYGPKPEILFWESAGSNRAAHIRWQVVTTIPECGTAYLMNKPTEFNYTVTWAIDNTGMTRRSVTGHIEIPLNSNYLTGSNTNRIVRTADEFRSFFVIPALPAFRREQEYVLSEDRRVLKFHVVDTQISSPNAYPPGVIEMEAAHELGSQLLKSGKLGGQGFVSWDLMISATIRLAPHMPQHYAWFVFLLIVQDRLNRVTTGLVNKVDRNSQSTAETSRYIVKEIKIREELYRREVRASIKYLVICSPASVLQASGMFQITPGDWNAWRVSVNLAHSQRGYANLGYVASEDAIIDLCNNESGIFSQPAVNPPNEGGQEGLFSNACPQPQHSWLDFQNNLTLVEKPNIVVSTKLFDNPISLMQNQALSPLNYRTTVTGLVHQAAAPVQGVATQVFVESRGSTRYMVRMKGYAIRLGYPINTPVLQSIGGKVATRISQGENKDGVIQAGNCPIYARSWDELYTLENIPGGDITKDVITDGIPEYYQN